MGRDGNGKSEGPRISSAVRPRCTACGQVVSAEARTCPWCGREVLCDVVITAAFTGGRSARARAAQELEALGAAGREVLAQCLERAPGVILSAVTRSVALQHLECLERHRVDARLVPAQPSGRGRRESDPVPRRLRAGVIAAVALLLLALALGLTLVAGLNIVGSTVGARGAARLGRSPAEARLLVERRASAGRSVRRAGGFYLTSHQVVTTSWVTEEAASDLWVNGSARAHLQRRDEWLDLALITVGGQGGSPLPLGDATQVRLGDRVRLPGTPAGEATVSERAVGLLGLTFIGVDADLGETDSGGPVLDAAGRVVGILSSLTRDGGPRALALPVNYLAVAPDPLLPEAQALDHPGWRRWLRGAGVAETLLPENLARELERPVLVGATAGPGRTAVAVVGRFSARIPPPAELAFQVLHGGRPLCSCAASASLFQPVSAEESRVPVPRQAAWLERHGLKLYLFTAAVSLDLSGCDRTKLAGSTLVVRDGLPQADRTTLSDPYARSRRSAERRRAGR